ncbi:hypothetical protein Pmani_019431 [Petrolisthes manimaculis]|uniref:Uncharacterized protein n=1 Tax=Petrolisthes manimaculis TaxID=1843537 RepID=A0AAE1PJL5_9EUCA|nr:hypothetical protein Pmani_019431 [Petrolisthes manimaculis]
MNVKTRYRNGDVVLQEADIKQVDGESVMEERGTRQSGGCCTLGTKCEILGGECKPRSWVGPCYYGSRAFHLCGYTQCKCCIDCKCGSDCDKVNGTCKTDCKPSDYPDVSNPCPANADTSV